MSSGPIRRVLHCRARWDDAQDPLLAWEAALSAALHEALHPQQPSVPASAPGNGAAFAGAQQRRPDISLAAWAPAHLQLLSAEEQQRVRQALTALGSDDFLVAVSPGALEALLRIIGAAGIRQLLDQQTPRLVAVGQGTAKAWQALGGQGPILAPEGLSGAAALLPMLRAETQPGSRLHVLLGETGRRDLAETMAVEGRVVTLLPVYRRVSSTVSPDAAARNAARSAEDFAQMAILVSSSSDLPVLSQWLGPGAVHARWIVHHPAVAEAVRQAYPSAAIVEVQGLSPADLVPAILQ